MTEDRALCAGRYRLERVLGRGASGVVYAAVDTKDGKPCAVKRLHAQFHDEATLEQLQRDVHLVQELAHPAIVAPFAAAFEDDGSFYLVSERASGQTLRARLQQGPLSLDEVRDLLLPLCAALEAAHARGLHHGDLCPNNIIYFSDGARITDFGMHRLGASQSTPWTGPAGYLAPEIYRGEVPGASARGDVFALGSVLFECLTGQRLFDGANAAAVMFRTCVGPLPVLPASVPGDRERLDSLIAMACGKDPAARFDHAGALWQAFKAVLGDAPASSAASGAPAEAAGEAAGGAVTAATTAPMRPVTAAPVVPEPTPAPAPDLDSWVRQESPPEPPRRGPRYGIIAGWTVAGGCAMAALLFIFTSSHDPIPAPTKASDEPMAAQAPLSATGAPAPSAGAAPAQSEASLLLAAEEKLVAEDYAAAMAAADELLRHQPADPAVRDLHRRSREALRLQAVYQGFLRAAERGDTDAAMALYRELSPGSPFRARAQGTYSTVRTRYDELHLSIASAALERGSCDDVQRQVDQLLAVAERADDWAPEKGRRLLARCKGRGDKLVQVHPGAEAGPARSGNLIVPNFGQRPRPENEAIGTLKDPFRSGKLPQR